MGVIFFTSLAALVYTTFVFVVGMLFERKNSNKIADDLAAIKAERDKFAADLAAAKKVI